MNNNIEQATCRHVSDRHGVKIFSSNDIFTISVLLPRPIHTFVRHCPVRQCPVRQCPVLQFQRSPTVHRLVKFGWVPFADLRLRSLAMTWNEEFTGWVKIHPVNSSFHRENSLPIWSCLWTKVHVASRLCMRPLVVCNALAHLCIPSFFSKI